MFITAFTNAHHLSMSWASSIQSIPPHPTSWKSILILSSHLRLGLPSGVFLSAFPTKTLYTPLLSRILATCPTHLILLDIKLHSISKYMHDSIPFPIRMYSTYPTIFWPFPNGIVALHKREWSHWPAKMLS